MSAPVPSKEVGRPKQQPPQRRPPTIFDQDTARARRLEGYEVQYTGDNFVLSGEVRALCGPLAALMTPMLSGVLAGVKARRWLCDGLGGTVLETPFSPEVVEVAAAVHALLLDVARLLGDRQFGASIAGRAAAAVVVSGPGFGLPEITDEDLRSGAWVEVLADHVAGLDVELAAQLGRAALPDGHVSDASGELSIALGRSLLSHRLKRLEFRIAAMRRTVAGRAQAAAEIQERAQQDTRRRLNALGLA